MGREAFIWDETGDVISRNSEEKDFKDSMGRKRRHVFLAPTLINLSNQPPRPRTGKGSNSLLPRDSYPTKVSWTIELTEP